MVPRVICFDVDGQVQSTAKHLFVASGTQWLQCGDTGVWIRLG